MGRLGGLLPFQSFPLRLRQPVINRHKLRGGERLAGLGQRQGQIDGVFRQHWVEAVRGA